MEGEGQQVNGYSTEEENTAFTDEADYNDEDYAPEVETASKRQKRHTLEQIRELNAVYDQCAHPDKPTQRALGKMIGLEPSQVQYWFQNHRGQMQTKAVAEENKMIKREKAALLAENASLRHAMLNSSCFTCGGATAPAELPAENRRLLLENARLKDECTRATALLNQILNSAAPPPVPAVIAVGRRRPAAVLSLGGGGGGGGSSRADRLRGHAEAAMEQFLMLATKGEPLWLPTPDGGEALSYLGCQRRGVVPVHHGFRPEGFEIEASRDAGIVRAGAPELITMLTDPNRWAGMFPGIVANVTARNDVAISPGNFGSCIQLLNAELHVQSPRLLNRSINFLRYTKRVKSCKWAVMDVSVDGILGPALPAPSRGSRNNANASANANNNINTVVPAWYTGCRLLPSGCLIEHMENDCCMVTWVVHAEYDETTVPITFRPLFRSGKAFGAKRWLETLQRECEYLAVLNSSQVPRGDDYTAAAISSMGKKGILELAQKMMAVFYSAVSGPVTKKSSNLNEWPVTVSVGTGAMKTDAAVRMVTWKQAGSVSDLVLSATTTVWLPNILPELVFHYLCDYQHRGEWDALANGAAVKELCSVATGQLFGNSVSVLYSNVTNNATNNKKMLILQQTCTDESGSMVVYAPVAEDSMRAVMNGGDHASVFLMPSGFAILPDGHSSSSSSRGRHAPRTSRAPPVRDNNAGSLVTVACQALLLDTSPSDNHAKAYDDVGKLMRRAVNKIKDAVGANVVVPA